MVKIVTEAGLLVPPFSVYVIDMMDAFYYADLFEETSRFEFIDKLKEYKRAVTLSDALFVVKNYKWDSLYDMNDTDGGYDVRVYDSESKCVYAAHAKYKDTWTEKWFL